MPYKDKEKAREARRAHYHANKQQYKDRNVKQVKRNQNFIVEYLSDNPCVDCGMKDIRCLQFDHIDRATKVANIGIMVSNGLGLESIQEEIRKCEVRCANCHSIRTCGQFNWYKGQGAL